VSAARLLEPGAANQGGARRLVEALHGFDEGGIDHMDSYLGSDEEGLCGSGGYGGMAGLASFNALGLDDVRDDAALLDGKRGGKVRLQGASARDRLLGPV
jgi:hypothetical protein